MGRAIKFDNALIYFIKTGIKTRVFTPEELKFASGVKPLVIRWLKAFGNLIAQPNSLWNRYVPCEYIENASSTSIDTGIKAQDNMEMLIRFKAITGSFYIFQSRQNTGATIYGISGSSSGNTINAYGVNSGISRTEDHIYTVKMTMVNRAITLYVKDETTGQEDTKTGTATSSAYPFPSPSTIKLFGDASKVASGVSVYRSYIKVDGQMVWDMYPTIDVTDGNKVVAYDDVTHKASVKVSGSFTGGELLQPISYLESTGTQYIDTEIIPKTFDYTITYEGAIKTLSAGPNCAWGYMGDSSNLPRWVCGTYSNKFLMSPNTTSQVDGSADTNNHTFVSKVYERSGVAKWSSEIDDVVKQDQTLASSDTWTTNVLSIYLFARHNVSGVGNYVNATMKKWICEKNGVVIKHLIPIRIGQVGYLLDLVSWKLYSNNGTGSFTLGADIPYRVFQPYDLLCNKGKLEYGVGKNLWDKSQGSIQGYPTDSGTWKVGTYERSITCKLEEGKTYTIVRPDNLSASYRVQASATYPLVNGQSLYIIDNAGSGTTKTITVPIGYPYVVIYVANKNPYTEEIEQTIRNTCMIVEGSTAPPYEPYHFGLHADGVHKLQISTGEEININDLLFSDDDYVDTQNGKLHHEWGVKVLDGTESWRAYAGRNDLFLLDTDNAFKPTTPMAIMCSHLLGSSESTARQSNNTIRLTYGDSQFGIFSIVVGGFTTISELKNWLASEYAKGTPVIVVYPLANPTTSDITPHPLEYVEGMSVTCISEIPCEVELEVGEETRRLMSVRPPRQEEIVEDNNEDITEEIVEEEDESTRDL